MADAVFRDLVILALGVVIGLIGAAILNAIKEAKRGID